MKEFIKHYFSLILTVLCACFAITVFFHNNEPSSFGIFTTIGSSFSGFEQKNNQSDTAQELANQNETPLPTVRYSKGTLTTGTIVLFPELFSLSFSDGTTQSAADATNTKLYLKDITNESGSSVLTTLTSEQLFELEEAPSSAVFAEDKELLYFHNSGIYKLQFRMFFKHHDGIFLECTIPVEVN